MGPEKWIIRTPFKNASIHNLNVDKCSIIPEKENNQETYIIYDFYASSWNFPNVQSVQNLCVSQKHAWLAGRAVLGALVSTKPFHDVFHLFFVLEFLYVYTAYTYRNSGTKYIYIYLSISACCC